MHALKLLVLSLLVVYVVASRLGEERSLHKGLQITDDLVRSISQYSDVDHFKDVLKSILVPRVVGTQNHEKVKEYLKSSMERLGWEVETDKFEDSTPLGKLKFENVVARLNPNARRYLVLACHYDSKYFREGSFVGATDSAVPCAMMINLAYTLKDKLDEIRNQTSLSLKLIFFDGEEAFEEWGPQDSIYGARHLARKWERTPYPHNAKDGTNRLHQMDLLVLLDLLGARNPSFYNFFSDTQRWYKRIIAIEKKLRNLQLISDKKRPSVASHPPQYFHERSFHSGIEDDHIPFMQRGVPVLHIIPYPFPDVWHTEDDNLRVVHFETVENLTKIMRVFVVSYLMTNA